MRFILQDDVFDNLPANWDNLVTAATEYVERKVSQANKKATDEGKTKAEIESLVLQVRHNAINAKRSVWSAAKEALKKAGNKKCWYCESKENRSDNTVDHFRPKNRVFEEDGHPGYWWLAFDWRNFRYSCTFCNSRRRDVEGGTEGGKQDHFPIIPPPPYAQSESDPTEVPKLLDPINDRDTKLLTFLPNGRPHPMTQDALEMERVEESIRLYHLDHEVLVRKRKRIGNRISQLVSNANIARNSNLDSMFRFHKKEIIKLVRAKAEYSTAARIYLQAHRTFPWVNEILERDL